MDRVLDERTPALRLTRPGPIPHPSGLSASVATPGSSPGASPNRGRRRWRVPLAEWPTRDTWIRLPFLLSGLPPQLNHSSCQILLGDGRAEAGVVGDEVGQEFVQAGLLEDVGAGRVLELRSDRACGALGGALAG